MDKLDYAVLFSGLGLFAFFGLSLLAFMANPIVASMDFLAGYGIIGTMLAGFGILVYCWFRRENKKIQIER